MNKINLRGSSFFESSRKLRGRLTVLRRKYSKDEKEKEEKELEIEEKFKGRKGVLHDKQQSIQEESYFHKEELEQLKGLKKKLAQESEEKKNDNKN